MNKLRIFVIFLCFSCSHNESNNVVSFDMDIDISRIVNPKTIIDSIGIIRLETNEESLIGKINKIIVSNDVIYVFDSKRQAILFFDIDGKYLNQIHRVGKGPGEYIRIGDFCLNNERNEIILLTDGRKLVFYSLDGGFLRTKRLHRAVCHFVECLSKDTLLLFSEFDTHRFHFYNIVKERIVKSKIKNNHHTDRSGFGHLYPPFSKKADGSYYFTDIYSYQIYNIETNGKIHSVKLNFGDYGYDMSKIPLDKGKDAYKERFTRLIKEGKYALNIFYFIETPDYYLSSFFLNKRIQTYIYDKNKKAASFLDQYYLPKIKYYENDYLYSPVEPLNIEKYIPKNFLGNQEDLEVDIMNDNPIILIYKFKKNG